MTEGIEKGLAYFYRCAAYEQMLIHPKHFSFFNEVNTNIFQACRSYCENQWETGPLFFSMFFNI